MQGMWSPNGYLQHGGRRLRDCVHRNRPSGVLRLAQLALWLVGALAIASGPALATEFKCGKVFVTFPIVGHEHSSPKIFTIPRKKIVGIVVTDKVAEFRKRYPQYNDMDYGALATAVQNKYYSDMSNDQYLELLKTQVAFIKIGNAEHLITMDTRKRILGCLD